MVGAGVTAWNENPNMLKNTSSLVSDGNAHSEIVLDSHVYRFALHCMLWRWQYLHSNGKPSAQLASQMLLLEPLTVRTSFDCEPKTQDEAQLLQRLFAFIQGLPESDNVMGPVNRRLRDILVAVAAYQAQAQAQQQQQPAPMTTPSPSTAAATTTGAAVQGAAVLGALKQMINPILYDLLLAMAPTAAAAPPPPPRPRQQAQQPQQQQQQ
jgi:hypothetical protein